MTDDLTWKQYRETLTSLSTKLSTSDAEPPEFLFHYTSAESCFSIIDVSPLSKDGPRLWASSVLGMNDAGEIRYGVNLVLEIARRFVPEEELERSFAMHWNAPDLAKVYSLLETTCVACFCDKPDLLSQWRAYSHNGTGYCLGFRRELISAVCSRPGLSLIPMRYQREVQAQRVTRIFKEASAIAERDQPEPEWRLWRTAIDAAIELSLGFKDASFSEECEWRLILKNRHALNLNFRAGRWGFIPYAEVALPRDCLASIWQGPTTDHDWTRRTLEMYLSQRYSNHTKFGPVQVCTSRIPLRKL